MKRPEYLEVSLDGEVIRLNVNYLSDIDVNPAAGEVRFTIHYKYLTLGAENR